MPFQLKLCARALINEIERRVIKNAGFTSNFFCLTQKLLPDKRDACIQLDSDLESSSSSSDSDDVRDNEKCNEGWMNICAKTQMEILELEMRARAIRSLLKKDDELIKTGQTSRTKEAANLSSEQVESKDKEIRAEKNEQTDRIASDSSEDDNVRITINAIQTGPFWTRAHSSTTYDADEIQLEDSNISDTDPIDRELKGN